MYYIFYYIGLIVINMTLFSNLMAASDPAVQIAKQAKNNVEHSGKHLQYTSDKVFKAFALKTNELQQLLDTRRNLEQTGLLDTSDPLGQARKRHINAKIVENIAELKTICDGNLDQLMQALDQFDQTVVQSIAQSQATRSINTNYELNLKQYMRKAKKRFDAAMKDATTYLQQCEQDKNNIACENYKRARFRIERILERKKLYETRMAVVSNNQVLSDSIRKQIKDKGFVISSRLRQLIAKLYVTFSKVTPVTIGYGEHNFSNMQFGQLDNFSQALEIVDNSVTKLNKVLDSMVNDVVGGLGKITEIDGKFVHGANLSTENELLRLQKYRSEW